MVTPRGNWDISRPWTIPAETLVLYKTEREWRFAVANVAGGIIDGRLIDTPVDAPETSTMAELVSRTEQATGRSYVAHWTCDKPEWWSARLHEPEKSDSESGP